MRSRRRARRRREKGDVQVLPAGKRGLSEVGKIPQPPSGGAHHKKLLPYEGNGYWSGQNSFLPDGISFVSIKAVLPSVCR